MPQIGWFELLLIVIIAILIIGPKDFPVVLKKLGSMVAGIKNYFLEIQKNVDEVTNLERTSMKAVKPGNSAPISLNISSKVGTMKINKVSNIFTF